MKSNLKRYLAVLLACMIMLTAMPVSALSEVIGVSNSVQINRLKAEIPLPRPIIFIMEKLW